jgi:manganese transport protein
MAIVLQALCARLAIATGRDLAQACRDAYPRSVGHLLWTLAELAIVATDLAEVIGTAIGLNLVFGIPLEIGVIITALDVFLILYLQNKGFRWVEAMVIALMGVIAVCFLVQIAMADPDWGAVIRSSASSGRRSCRITSTCITASFRPAPMAARCPRSGRRCASPRSTRPSR